MKAKALPVASVLLLEGAELIPPRRRGHPPKVTPSHVDVSPHVVAIPSVEASLSVEPDKPECGHCPKVGPLPAEMGQP